MTIVDEILTTNSEARMGRIARKVMLFIIVFIPFVGISFWYNYYRFGSFFETGFHVMASRLGLNFFWGTPLLTGLMVS